MKALLTLALAASALTLSSCASKDGSCPLGFKNKDCCAKKACCAKKEACCKN